MILYKKLPFFLILLLILAVGCETQHDLEKIKTQVNEMNNLTTKAMLENDYESTLLLYTDDAISLPSYQPMMRGIDEFKQNIEKQKEMPMNMTSFVLNSTDVWVSGDFVVDIGTYELSMVMPEMEGGDWKDNGKYLTLYEIQDDGSLLMKAETWNTDLNPWMDMMEKLPDDSTEK